MGFTFYFEINMGPSQDQAIEKDKVEPKGKETREERRWRERISNEARIAFSRLCAKYEDVFMENSPDDEVVMKFEREISTKWLLYCNRKGLNEEAKKLMTTFLKEYREEYKKLQAE